MSAPPQDEGRADHRSSPAHRVPRGRVQAQGRVARRHRAREVRLHSRRPAPAAVRGERGIRALLEGLAAQFNWQIVTENELPIALQRGGASVTLEPGGQVELSGAPVKTLHETCCEVHEHLDQVRAVAAPLGIGMLGLGFQPKWRREDIPWMPKGRYRIMGSYMPTKGRLGLDMMLRTCTIQTNLDFSIRGRHGAEVPGRAGLAAGGDRAVRQLAVHRRAAERLPQLSQPRLDGYRSRPLRHPAVRVRGWHGLRALRRARARRADVFRLPRRQIH